MIPYLLKTWRAASNLQNPYQSPTYLTMAGGWVYFDWHITSTFWQPYSCLRNHYVAQPLKRLLNMLATSSLRHWRWTWSGPWTCGSWASSWWKVRLWRGFTPCGPRTTFNEKKESVQWIDVFFFNTTLIYSKEKLLPKNDGQK